MMNKKIIMVLIIIVIIIVLKLSCDFIINFNLNKNLFENLNDKYIFSQLILDNKLILIFPIYNQKISETSFKISLLDYDIKLNNIIEKIKIEPIQIFIYNIIKKKQTNEDNNNKLIKGKFEYNNFIDKLNINPIYTNKVNLLGITTLFKNDYKLFPLFYNYYTKQGVDKFYMYYNGNVNDEIKKIFDKPNVVLINWNYRYWNKIVIPEIKYSHHAQMGQMHDAIYRYGKPECEYMIFCDLDEYMYIKNNTLSNYIKDKTYDVIEFHNYFSKLINGNIYDDNIVELPETIKIGYKYPYSYRSKNIYKTSCIDSINIHTPEKFNILSPKKSHNNYLLHFHNNKSDSYVSKEDHKSDNIFNIKDKFLLSSKSDKIVSYRRLDDYNCNNLFKLKYSD